MSNQKKIFVHADSISVDFPIFENSQRSFKNRLISLSTGGMIHKDIANNTIVTALDNLSFKFKKGDRVGFIGHNGSGKTTLLRVIAGIYSPTSGDFNVQGNVASLLDVSLGFDPDATGYENIYLRCILSNISSEEIEKRIEEISNFSELGNYLSLPIRTYSSGMQLRLAFSISTCVDADIIIMDEWLSVGDSDFNKKAADRLNLLVNKASILILASHDLDLIKATCNRIITLEHGKIIKEEKNEI